MEEERQSLTAQAAGGAAAVSARPAIIALILSNLLPVAGVLLLDWRVADIITLYWGENLILGAITLIKMAQLGGAGALGRMLFFTVHYGVFCAGHGLFITELFGIGDTGVRSTGLAGLVVDPVQRIFGASSQLWWWAFIALAASHTASFVFNYLGAREYRHETVSSLMSAPYSRIVILHVTVLFGGLAINALGAPVGLLLVLIAVKLFADVALHRHEHNKPGRAYDGARASTEKPGSKE